MNFNDLLDQRRSIYEFSNEVAMTNQTIQEAIEHTLLKTPSAFNAQTQRVVVLLDGNSELFWRETLKLLLPLTENKEKTTSKIETFVKAKGTILFYDDTSITKALEEKFPLYQKNFSIWAFEQNGMLQMNIWNRLTELGLGASLQHYNEIVESRVRELFDIQPDWKLIGQMPFGKPVSIPDAKPQIEISRRVIVK